MGEEKPRRDRADRVGIPPGTTSSGTRKKEGFVSLLSKVSVQSRSDIFLSFFFLFSVSDSKPSLSKSNQLPVKLHGGSAFN
ncbi:hypothetical protein LOK49_LG05G03854 [Camellia lanceoleosa]|uniref:Uncharacterized protein n=1 Tax=Camellia lanceoleosa TaxID=1840588 RepID=A0ACC0HIR9_9ERIC|nr:hypothetical protein LOK49_LG05G03854 [Camellia lanceoleosa]